MTDTYGVQAPVTPSSAAHPQTLARIARLELRARTVVDGMLSGMHRSPHRGSSVEFAQHRDYVPGDEIRHIDWKVYARSDRYHIKQFEEETNLRATVLLDVSESMNYRGAQSALSKRDYAAVCSVALASLLIRQRDAVALAICGDGVEQFVPHSSTPGHTRTISETIEKAKPSAKSNLGGSLHDLAERMQRRGLLLAFSDFFTQPEDVMRGLQHFRHRHHEVVLFHVLDRDEIEFPFKTAATFLDMEVESAITAEPNALRREYLAAFGAFVEGLKRDCRELGMDYVLLRTDEPVDTTLARYLATRMNRAR